VRVWQHASLLRLLLPERVPTPCWLDQDIKLRSQIEKAKQSVASTVTPLGSQRSPEPFFPASCVTFKLLHSSFSAAAGEVYPIKDSFILNSGATIHVCNSRSRFQSFRKCDPSDVVYAGLEKMPMVGVGSVDITISTGTTTRNFRLENAAFIPSFHTNVVSLSKFTAVGVHWNTAVCQLIFNKRRFCDVTSRFGQWVPEFNPVFSQTKEQPVSAFPTRSTGPRHDAEATTELWHRRLGYLNNEAVLKLSSAAIGVRVINRPGPSCQVCPVAKSTIHDALLLMLYSLLLVSILTCSSSQGGTTVTTGSCIS
jgi:hypothetical protein